jgi:hypothetical protein
MKLRRGGFLSPFKILLVLVGAFIALTLAINGSASTNDEWSSCDPNNNGGVILPTSGRAFCAVLKTYDGVQPNGGQKVDVYFYNYDQNTLTNPTMTITPVPSANLNVTWSEPKPSNCTKPPTSASITCTFANVTGLGSAANPSPSPNPNQSQVISLYFQTVATGTAPWTLGWTATGRVNEGPSGPPNQSVASIPANAHTSFGTAVDSALTFALAGQTVQLGSTATGKASLKFGVPGGTAPYETSLTADDSTDFCLDGLSCYPLELISSVPGSTGGLLIWHFVALDPSFSRNQARVIHIRDGVTTTADRGANTIAGDFRGVDGVRITGSPAPGFDGDYWVRNPSATSSTISQLESGPLFDIPGSSGTVTITAAKIFRVGLRDEDCKTQAGAVTTPSMWVDSVDADNDTKKDDLEFWFCDNGNGNVGPWG